MTINLKLDLYFVFRCTVYCCVSTLQQVVLEELVHRLHLTISWNASNLKHILIILKSVPSFCSSTLSYHSHLSAFLTLDSKLYQSVSCCVTDTERKILRPYSGQKKKNLRSPLKLTWSQQSITAKTCYTNRLLLAVLSYSKAHGEAFPELLLCRTIYIWNPHLYKNNFNCTCWGRSCDMIERSTAATAQSLW